MRYLRRSVRGFALLEVVFALGILGVATAGIVSLMRTVRTSAKIEKTQRALETASQALVMFAQAQGRLPAAAPTPDGFEHQGSSVGRLPYKTLCLDAETVLDGNGQVLFYVANPDLTGPASSSALDALAGEGEPTGLGAIRNRNLLKLIDANGLPALESSQPEDDFCAFVVFSFPSYQELQGCLSQKGETVQVQLPPKRSLTKARWMSRNRLLAKRRG